ncbi:MAG: type II toxin-antitoxin system VapC family toxin [Rhodoferax sp.]|jgi:predicted nucleic acid-binding protein|nr:type II toxin-antitoxin system VapC family toxin [Rhodoferax sp.]
MNIVDSCGWLEFIANGQNADFFQPVLEDEEQLLLPGLVAFEVIRRLMALKQDVAIGPTLAVMGRLKRVDLTVAQLAQAAFAARTHKLAMADAIIWQTAQVSQARLYTQDIDLQGLPGVVYQARRLNNEGLIRPGNA